MEIEEIKKAGVPAHVAIIMDGNGRWAESQGLERVMGHKEGVESVRRAIEAAAEVGVSYLTLYAFSIENWNRPKAEVDALMELLVDAVQSEKPELMRQNVQVRTIGNIASMPTHVQAKINHLIEDTSVNTGLCVVLALSYGSRWEIVEAAKSIAQGYKTGEITETELDNLSASDFSAHLNTSFMPDPDLLIRTSGECRLSNFLLWQCAYTEFYFIDKFWPDFKKEDLYLAIRSFQTRERRFGMTGSQLKK
ncbi:MAG: isoprenyl transferase [Marinifilaceae bacterium]